MRILVHGDSMGAGCVRLRRAAEGLALRGHDVAWLERADSREAPGWGPDAELTLHRASGALGFVRSRSEIALGGGASPARVALAAWVAGAQTMVLELGEGDRARWGFWDRWCWESLPGLGVGASGPHADDPDWAAEETRRASWPEAAAPEAADPAHADTEKAERWCEHALALRLRRGPRPAVFLDRDGTLVVEKGYLSRPEELELIPGAGRALRRLHAAGYALVVVSNQAGVGRGIYPLEAAYRTMRQLRVVLRAEGIELDAVYFCPHRPEDGCACRKPGTALLEQAVANLRLSLRHSVMIGDKLIDAAAGQSAGAQGVLVRTGYGREEEARIAEAGQTPEHVTDDLEGAADWLLALDRARPQD